jgi:PAS domain S-box-containing protein
MNVKNQELNQISAHSTSNDFGHLFETHSDAVCVFNMQGDILYINQALTQILHYTKEELLGVNFIEVVASEGIDIFNYYFQKAIISDTQEFITPLKCKNGTIVEIKIVTVSNEVDGQIVSVSGFISDAIEPSVIHESEIQTTNDLYESFIVNNRDPILLLDLDAIIVLANHAFSRLLGWRKENLEGFHILQCPSIPPHLVDQMREYYGRVVNEEKNLTTLETIRISTEGKAHYMMLSITSIQDRNGKVCNWAVHLRDITAQKEAEKSLIRAEKLLALGQIATNIADEIRNPLLSLKGFIQALKDNTNENIYNDGHLIFLVDELNRIETILNDLSMISTAQSKP